MTRWIRGVLGLACMVALGLGVAFGADPPAKTLPNVKILATGGTIAGTAGASTRTVGYTSAVLAVDKLIVGVPELKTIANVSGEQISQIGSENMTSDIWLKLAKRVNQLLASNEVDGIVITHGTDTLEETAYFLNLVTKSDKPVVLCGAMRPATAMSADGPMNIYNSVLIAGNPAARGKGVLVTMNDVINGARDVTKTNTSTVDTFRAPELGFLGYIQDGKPYFYKESTRKHTTGSVFDVMKLDALPRVDIVYGYANNSRAMIDAAVAAGAKGIVHAGVGNGSVFQELQPAMKDARKKGVVIVRSSRVGNGLVARNGEVNDDEFDTVVADNLNPQKARVLLMLALTQTRDTKAIQSFYHEY
jgi:L-asparaginase